MRSPFKAWFRALKAKYPVQAEMLRVMRSYLVQPLRVSNSGSQNALISYISRPFRMRDNGSHSNQKEVLMMADVLAELGYSVDVIDHDSNFDIDYSKYDLLIGFGPAFSRSFSAPDFCGKRILHITGANPNFSNEAEARRAKSVRERRGRLLAPRREVHWSCMFSAINADALFVLGNQWTLSTYNGLNESCHIVPVPYVPPADPIPRRQTASTKKHFCWFGGGGAIHKGLDLLLDAISELDSNFHLDVCGPVQHEEDFVSAYQDELLSNPHVTFRGFVDVSSEEMRTIMAENSFVIFPSCSEGSASSVLTCMAAGLIPVVTEESGIEIIDFGLRIKQATTGSIQEAMRLASSLSDAELGIRSQKASEYARRAHSRETYSNVLRESLVSVLRESATRSSDPAQQSWSTSPPVNKGSNPITESSGSSTLVGRQSES
jgi:glycosyltransferase involved in cell wall biosynthesis